MLKLLKARNSLFISSNVFCIEYFLQHESTAIRKVMCKICLLSKFKALCSSIETFECLHIFCVEHFLQHESIEWVSGRKAYDTIFSKSNFLWGKGPCHLVCVMPWFISCKGSRQRSEKSRSFREIAELEMGEVRSLISKHNIFKNMKSRKSQKCG